MYLESLKLENFRKYKNLKVNFTKGLNLLVGENDSGKTAIVDAIKYVLGTQSYDFIRPQYEDFHLDNNGVRSTKFRITCIFRDLKPQEAAHFLDWIGMDDNGEYYLKVWLEANRNDNRVFYEIRAGIDDEGTQLSSMAKDYLRSVYLKPLRDAENELSPKKGSRLSQILSSRDEFIDKENHTLKKIFEEANIKIKEYFKEKEGKIISDDINKYLSDFSLNTNRLNSEFQVSESSLKSILEKLSLKIGESIPGLGSHNILYIAVEMLLLKKDYTGLKLVLVEEIEAHIHPQLQMKLIKEIQKIAKDYEIQFILTSHSPNLASKVELENLILCKNNDVFPMGSKYTQLLEGDYKFLERFLDVTKANLFFANGVMLVEGNSENILIPTLASLIGRDLTDYGVSIVNVGGVAFLRYSRIFLRNDDKNIDIPVAVVTDVDVKPDEDGNYKNKSEKKIEKKRKKYSKDNVKAFITPYWTLEYTLALSGLSEIFYQAVYICDKTRNDDYKYDESDIKEYIKQANEIYKKWKEEKTNKEIAYEIYKKTIISKRISKVAVAQVFAKLLIDNSESVKDIILKDEYLIYLIDAIKYVTSGSNDSNNR